MDRNSGKSLSRRNTYLIEQYNYTTNTLCSLQKRQIVSIQCQTTHQWDTSGRITETLPNHQYQIRVDRSGRIPLWNHRFLQKLEAPTTLFPISSAPPHTHTHQQQVNTKNPINHSQWNKIVNTTTIKQYRSATYTDTNKNTPGLVQITPTQPARLEGKIVVDS